MLCAITTVFTNVVVEGLPSQAFWDNDWPSDLVLPGGGDDGDTPLRAAFEGRAAVQEIVKFEWKWKIPENILKHETYIDIDLPISVFFIIMRGLTVRLPSPLSCQLSPPMLQRDLRPLSTSVFFIIIIDQR